MRPGQIGMAATCGNGYVFDKLLKKKKCWRGAENFLGVCPEVL